MCAGIVFLVEFMLQTAVFRILLLWKPVTELYECGTAQPGWR